MKKTLLLLAALLALAGVAQAQTVKFAGQNTPNTFSALQTFNPSTTPGQVIRLDIAAIGSAGTRDSHTLEWCGQANDGTEHTRCYRAFVDVTANDGAATYKLQTNLDGGSWTDIFSAPTTGLDASSFFVTGTIPDARIDGSAESDEVNLTGDVDGVANANDLDEAAVRDELEGVLRLQSLQGAVTDGQVPNNITIDLATLATTATTANAGDSATAFFSAGQIEAARGGTGIDTSGSTGVLRVSSGTWTANAGISHLASSTSADLRAVLSNEVGTGAAMFGLHADMSDDLNCDGSNNVVIRNTGDTAFECAEINVQGTANEITSSGSGLAPTLALATQLALSNKEILGATPFAWEGATDNDIFTRLVVTDPTVSDKTFTIPNANSVAVQPDTGAANNFLTAISALGVISKAQPAFTDISGTTDPDQLGGGTAADDKALVADSASAATWRAIPDCNTGSMLTYEIDTNTFGCEADDGGGGDWDDIGNPAGDGSIDFAATEQDIIGQLDSAGKAMLTLTNQDADRAAATTILALHDYDTGDGEAVYLRMVADVDGTPVTDYEFRQDGVTFGKTGAAGEWRFYDTGGTNYTGLKAPASVTTSYVWEMPDEDASGCVSSDGAGTLSIAACAAGANTALSNLASVAINEHLLFGADNTKDIGADGETRPRSLYLGTSLIVQGSGAGVIRVTSGTNPSCGAGQFKIWANTSDGKWKKCEDTAITDLDTTSAGGTDWDDIGNAGADGSVDFVATEQDIVGQLDSAGKAMLTLTNQDADRGNATEILALHDYDTGDADAVYLRMRADVDGTPAVDYEFRQDGATFNKALTANVTGALTGNASTATALAANGGNCSGNEFALGVDASGVAECAQPAFSNLSGSATDGQIPNNITVDLATTATTANAGDSATAFFSSGTLEDARLSSNVALYDNGSKTWGAGSSFNWTFNAGATDPVLELSSGNVKWSGATTFTWEGGASDPVLTPGNGVWNLTTGTIQQGGTAVGLAGSCTNQVVTAVNNGAPTCADVTSALIGADTITDDDVAAELDTVTKSFVVLVPATGLTNYAQLYFPTAVTITRVACSIDAGTSVTIQLDERAEATPNTAGSDVMTSALVCDTDSQTTTSFTNAGIAARVPLNLQITGTSGSVNALRVHVEATID